MISISVILASGFWSLLRIAEQIVRTKLISEKAMTKIGTAYFAWVVTMALLLHRDPVFLFVVAHFPAIALFIFDRFGWHWKIHFFRRYRTTLLSSIILKMKTGRGFRESLRATCGEAPAFLQHLLVRLPDYVVFSQHCETLESFETFRSFVRELREVDRSAQGTIPRLHSLRERWLVVEDFRRRSGQVLLHVRIQCVVMVGLYLALLTAMLKGFGWSQCRSALFVSMPMFLLGMATTLLLGGRIKWKI